MLRRTLALGLLISSVSGCCTYRIDRPAFRDSSLAEQIRLYEAAIAGNCVRNDMLQLLDAIASHGSAAADAMTALLREPRENFPLEHAMYCLKYTRFHGVDLEQHPGMAELRRLADSHEDEAIRAQARKALEDIERYRPPAE